MTTNDLGITKKLKMAFRRWSKKCKAAGWDGFSEPFMSSALFMIKISQNHHNIPEKSLVELLQIVQKENDTYFIEQQEKQMMRVKAFAELQKLSEKETNELINDTKEKLAIELKKYQEQRKDTLKLFDYNINNSGEIFEDLEDSKVLIKKLDELGYLAVLINKLKVVYEKNKCIGVLASKYLDNGYDIVTSGTFFMNAPLGTIILKNGETFITKEPKALRRGGVAILKSGIINYSITDGCDENSVRTIFDDKPSIADIQFPEISEIDEISEFMGGGALLIYKGEKVAGEDLLYIQKFNQGYKKKEDGTYEEITNGLDAEQFRKTSHVLICKCNELDYLVLPKEKHSKNGRTIQNELHELGFEYLMKFDGGNGYWVNSELYNAGKNGKNNRSGFAIKKVRL